MAINGHEAGGLSDNQGEVLIRGNGWELRGRVKPVLRLPLDGAQDGREKRGRWGDQPAAAQDAGQRRRWRRKGELTGGPELSVT
jgi:hypothetical protein